MQSLLYRYNSDLSLASSSHSLFLTTYNKYCSAFASVFYFIMCELPLRFSHKALTHKFYLQGVMILSVNIACVH